MLIYTDTDELFNVIHLQQLPETFLEGYCFKKDTLYCARTYDGWMRVFIDFDMNKPTGFCGAEWEKFCDKQMIDGSQSLLIYFIVGHHFIITIHDVDGFCEDPEFRGELVCFFGIFLLLFEYVIVTILADI